VLFGHVRGTHDPKRVVGRCVKLYKENSQLIAEVEFDEEEAFAKEVAGKVERGFIKMASLYADIKETSIDEDFILPTQTLATVTKCKMVELSIVDVGGNDDALKLSRGGKAIKLTKIGTPKQTENTNMKSIALALGQKEDATEGAILQSVTALKLAKDTADEKAAKAENALKVILSKQADTLVEKAVSLGLVPDALKETIRGSFDTDHEAQTVKLTKMISDKEAADGADETHGQLKEVILGKDGKKPEVKLTFDYLQKHDVPKLKDIRDNNPTEYARLAKEYGQGVRHVEQLTK
jgi:hypothetical protein